MWVLVVGGKTEMGFLYEPIIVATIGGFLYNLLPWLEESKKPPMERPDVKGFYKLARFLFMPFLGGFLAYIYQTPEAPLTKMTAFHIGLSSPLILKQMLLTLPTTLGEVPLKDSKQ
jgi:hypothetical protein